MFLIAYINVGQIFTGNGTVVLDKSDQAYSTDENSVNDVIFSCFSFNSYCNEMYQRLSLLWGMMIEHRDPDSPSL